MSDFCVCVCGGGGGGGYVRQSLETVNRSEENIWEEETHQAQIPGKTGQTLAIWKEKTC